jgi:hypothetical protein
MFCTVHCNIIIHILYYIILLYECKILFFVYVIDTPRHAIYIGTIVR